MGILNFINKSFGTYYFKGYYIEPTYWQAGAIVFLIFLLILTLARLRYIYVEWHFSRQNLSFLFYGFLLALIMEGFFLISGRTLFTQLLGWKNAPKPIGTALDLGREKLVDVLGSQSKIPSSVASEKPTPKSLITVFQSLSEDDKEEARSQICKP
jgi:uncharacterized membrane protein YhfC